MKRLLAGFAALATLFVLLPSNASAGNPYRSVGTCGSCGAHLKAQHTRVGYDRCGRPIYRYVRLPHSCRSHRSPRYSGRSSYGYSPYNYFNYRSRSGCDSRRRGGFSISIYR